MYFDWKTGGGRASNTQKVGAKNYSFNLYGKIKKTSSSVLRLVEGRRRASNSFKHPESKDINCSFELHGVNSIFLVYRTNSTRSTRVGPQANHVKDVMAIWRLCYGIFAIQFFSIDQFIAIILVQNSRCVRQKQNQNCICLV